ncbi:unnamed protein product [Mortierella alpina]
MRLTVTLAALSAAALASASVLRNTASNLCMGVNGGQHPFELVLSPCKEVKHGDWVIDVKGDDSAVIRNSKLFEGGHPLCVGTYVSESNKPALTLEPCFLATVFNRVEDTSSKRWSFSTMMAGVELALAPLPFPGHEREVALWPLRHMQGGVRLYEWSTSMPKEPRYQGLYDWMRFQDW